jgi:Sulfatase
VERRSSGVVPAERATKPPQDRRYPRVGLLWAGVHVAALNAIAIAWPYFQPLIDAPYFVLLHMHSPVGIAAVAFGLVLIPPVVLVAVEALAGLVSTRLRDLVHLAFLAGYASLIAWQALFEAETGWPELAVALVALVVGAIAALAYWRLRPVRLFVSFLSVAPVLALVLFLGFSPVSDLVFRGAGPGPVEGVRATAPVVMIVFDELPTASLMDERGRIDPVRYPNFARVARDGTWYRNAASVADETQIAVPSLLTGRAAESGRLPVAAQHPDNLFRLLGSSHRLDVIEWMTSLCEEPVCPSSTGRSFSERVRMLMNDLKDVPTMPRRVRHRIAEVVRPDPSSFWEAADGGEAESSVRREGYQPRADAFSAFARYLRPERGRSLHFLHVVLPHFPWEYLPDGRRPAPTRSELATVLASWPTDPTRSTIAYQRHLFQLAYTDRLLGRVLRRLDEIGRYRRSLIVLTADHGINFEPRTSSRVVSGRNTAGVAAVPLIVKAPNQRRGRISDAYVKSTDVLPTMAAALGVRVPWRVEGIPADKVRRPGAAKLTVHRAEGGGRVSVAHRTLASERDREVRRKVALFGSRGWDRINALGGQPELLGRPVSRLRLQPPGRARATVDAPSRFRSVAPGGRYLPADVSGSIHGVAPARRRVAIAINGRIAATARTVVLPAGEVYTALCAPSAFRRGANRVEVFALFDGGRLTPLGSA